MAFRYGKAGFLSAVDMEMVIFAKATTAFGISTCQALRPYHQAVFHIHIGINKQDDCSGFLPFYYCKPPIKFATQILKTHKSPPPYLVVFESSSSILLHPKILQAVPRHFNVISLVQFCRDRHVCHHR